MLSNFTEQKDVARILARRNGSDFEIRRQLGRQILQAVDGEIDAAFGQGLFNFLREHALGADFGQRDVGNLVAGGLE